MAAIDKTYISDWKQYCDLKQWCDSVGRVTDDYGNRFRPSDFMNEWTEKDFSKLEDGEDLPVWNTPTYMDVWLVRNCPLQFMQDRLREQYGGGWSKTAFTGHNRESLYQEILDRTSPYDTYERNGLGQTARISIDRKLDVRFKDTRMVWWIDVLDSGWWYSCDTDRWFESSIDLHNRSKMGRTSSSCIYRGYMPVKKILRKIRKWDLPEGTRIRFCGEYHRYVQKDFVVTVRKPRKK